MLIPLWTENNPYVKEILLSTTSIEWSDLSTEEKERFWKYIQYYLFDPKQNSGGNFNKVTCNYKFFGNDSWENDHLAGIIVTTIVDLNHKYKKQSYARNFLDKPSYDNACHDFYRIFIADDKDIVFELFSIFSNTMVAEGQKSIYKKQNERNASFEKRKETEGWRRFDRFSTRFNEVLNDFGINFQLTRAGIILSDEPAVIEEIYEPALKKLSNKKWADANRDLRDSFQAMSKDKDGSGAITHALSALQGFMQILVYGKTGKGNTGQLITDAIKSEVIPDDDFSKNIINDMNSFWAKERQDKGDPHPKKQYATKEQAKLVISLVMVFIDHVL